jgi:hypothetical protein
MHRDHRASVAAIITTGIRHGDVPAAVDAEAIAEVWVATFRGLAYQWLLDPDSFPIVRALAEMARLFTPLLTAPPAPDPVP